MSTQHDCGLRILAVEMSGEHAGFCHLAGDGIEEVDFAHPPRATGPAFSLLADLLARRGNPNLIAIGLGPGSYNGLRVAISMAEGLRISTGARVTGRCSLAGLPEGKFFVVGDARAGQFFAAVFENGNPILSPVLLGSEGEARALCHQFPDAAPHRIGNCAAFADWPAQIPRARNLAERIAEEIGRGIFSFNETGEPLEPIYLKPPHITPPRAAPTSSRPESPRP